MFDAFADTKHSQAVLPVLPAVESWKEEELLSKEKSVLGFYVSGHPMERWRIDVEAISNLRLGEVDALRQGETVRVAGIISEMRTKIDKRGRTMAFATLEDFTGRAECLIFADAFERAGAALHEDAIVVMIGRAESSGDSIRLFPTEIHGIEDAIKTMSKSVVISLSLDTTTSKHIYEMKRVLERYSGSGKCPCYFFVLDERNATVGNGEWKLFSKKYRVEPSKDFLHQLRATVGESAVRISVDT